MIKFLNLHQINQQYVKEINRSIQSIIDSGRYLQGKQNEHFCENFAKYCGTKYAIGVANGLDALNLIIKGYGFGDGDEIIVPANTYIASILAISGNGCNPVLIEPDINTYNINVDLIEEKITSKTRAIMVVHLYGQAVQAVHSADEISYLAQKFPENIKMFGGFINSEFLGGAIIYETPIVAHTQYITTTEKGKEVMALELVMDYLVNNYYAEKKYFSFGISTEHQGRYLNTGLISQKEMFGGRGITHDFYEIVF